MVPEIKLSEHNADIREDQTELMPLGDRILTRTTWRSLSIIESPIRNLSETPVCWCQPTLERVSGGPSLFLLYQAATLGYTSPSILQIGSLLIPLCHFGLFLRNRFNPGTYHSILFLPHSDSPDMNTMKPTSMFANPRRWITKENISYIDDVCCIRIFFLQLSDTDPYIQRFLQRNWLPHSYTRLNYRSQLVFCYLSFVLSWSFCLLIVSPVQYTFI